MRFQEITETVDDDIDAAKLARTAAYTVMRAIHGGKAHALAEVDYSGTDFLLYNSKDCGLSDHDDLALMFGLKKPNTVGASGSCIQFTDPVMGNYTRAMVIYGLSSVDEETVRGFVASMGFIRLFHHEFIHVLDFQKHGTNIKGGNSGAGSRADYYNDPSEFNAYTHDLASDMTSVIEDLKQTEPKDHRDLLSLYDFTGDFTTDIKKIMQGNSTYTKAFLKWITNDRRKALLKRLYRLHTEMMCIVNRTST